MCGAITLEYKPAFKKELAAFFTEHELKDFEQKGEIVFAYWNKRPVLPVKHKTGITFIEWGNRNANLSLPQTGWARLESLL